MTKFDNVFRNVDVRSQCLATKQPMLHLGERHRFRFDWNWLVNSGLSVKDFIAPDSFTFKKNRQFQMGGTYGSMSVLNITASEISDRMLADILDLDSNQIVTIQQPFMSMHTLPAILRD